MRIALTLAAILGLAVASPASAQSSNGNATTGSNGTSSAASTPTPGAMANDVKKDLEQAGFTEIQVMPSSFLVRAKDKAGRPIMMVINPDSVTEISNVHPNDTQGTTGSSGSNTSTKN